MGSWGRRWIGLLGGWGEDQDIGGKVYTTVVQMRLESHELYAKKVSHGSLLWMGGFGRLQREHHLPRRTM